jgi:hypothetical protein
MTERDAVLFAIEWGKCRNWCEQKMLRLVTKIRKDYADGKSHTEDSLRDLMRKP